MLTPKTALIKSSLCLSLLVCCHFIALGQAVIKLDTTQFFRLYTGSTPIDVQFKSPLTNLTQDSLSLRWTVETGPSWPVDWRVYVADQNFSFVPGISTSPIPTELAPGDSGFYFGSGIFFNGTPGCSEYRIILSDYEQDSVVYDTITYSLNVNDPACSLTSIDPAVKLDLKIFPNPVSDYFIVQSSQRYKSIKCYDLLGRELMSWARTASERYDLSPLSPGQYWLMIEVEEGHFATHKIVKD
ncbi:MAG: T9SS type A sorting domain-containing protein [Bacteroidia bacterium]